MTSRVKAVDGPSPQRWLEAGEELRTCKGVDVVSRWQVPPTLRLLPSDLRELRKIGLLFD